MKTADYQIKAEVFDHKSGAYLAGFRTPGAALTYCHQQKFKVVETVDAVQAPPRLG